MALSFAPFLYPSLLRSTYTTFPCFTLMIVSRLSLKLHQIVNSAFSDTIMAAVVNRVSIGLKDTTITTSVPDNATARLMYYLECICTVLQMEPNAQMSRLRDFENYWRLDDDDKQRLLVLCLLLSPDKLTGKCIFQDDDLCGDSGNKFFELSAVRNTLLVSQSILINGRTSTVTKIMTYKMSWLLRNFLEPLKEFQRHLQHQIEAAESHRRRRSSFCAII